MIRKITLVFLMIIFSSCQGMVLGPQRGVVLNDIHSRLNKTKVWEVVYPESTEDLIEVVKRAKRQDRAISISGGRHAMGGQQFGEGTIHVDMSRMNDILSFDREKGIIKIEAGLQWPPLIEYLIKEQQGEEKQWGIIQKQSGANKLSIGGALSANIHGRGVRHKPIIQDVEAFTLVNANGDLLNVSRKENAELFRLVIGGYGLFGIIATVDLRLQPRIKLKRVVEIVTLEDLPEKTKQRLQEGYLYGDYQYKTDENAPDFMQVGVFSGYKPVAADTPLPEHQLRLSDNQWNELLLLAHIDKSKAFEKYSQHYLKTNGQIYWSDIHNLSFYNEGYVEFLNASLPHYPKGSLMITEVYVPRDKLSDFIKKIINDVHKNHINIIYGTMRLIERDEESFLAWAKQDYACIIFNLRVDHSKKGLQEAQKDFQLIIDRALELGGSYYLTYHRWARKDQVLAAYPQFPEFLRWKLQYDPQERFQSQWYRHYKKMFKKEMNL